MYTHDIMSIVQFQSKTKVSLTARSSTTLQNITDELGRYHALVKTDLEAKVTRLEQLDQLCGAYLDKAKDPTEAQEHRYRTWKRGKRGSGIEVFKSQLEAKLDYLQQVIKVEQSSQDILIAPIDKLSLRERFQRTAKAVMILGDPAQGRLLGHHYWSEIIDPLHRSVNKPGNKEIYERWLDERYGVAASTNFSFYRWLETQDIASMSSAMYQSAEQRNNYRIHWNGGRLTYDALGVLPADTAGNKTNFSGAGWSIYVLSPDGMLYAGDHSNPDESNPAGFYHSCFLAGAKVSAAGELKIRNGHLQAVSPKSGHYKPKAKEVVNFLQWLDSKDCLDADCKVQWFPMRDGRLFPLTGYDKLFPVFWYSARQFLQHEGEVDDIQPLRREAQTEGGIGQTGRFVFDHQKVNADPFHFTSYVGLGDKTAVTRLGWVNWL